MNSTLPTPFSLPAPTVRTTKARKLAILATALLAVLIPPAQVFGAGIVSVDIYSDYTVANAPNGMPYSGYAGQLELSSDAFTGAGYTFGQPFGLSSFAAIVSFSMYMSTEGYYIGGLNSGNSPVLWTKGGVFNPFSDGPWAWGARYNEVLFSEGFHDFEILFLAGSQGSFGGDMDIGGSPFQLSVAYFTPWGGDPRVLDGAYSYVVPASDEPLHALPIHGQPQSVPDSVGTLGALSGALLLVLALKRRLLAPVACPAI